MAARISETDFDEKVLKSQLPVIVDFYADSCVACKRLAPVLAEAEEDFEGRLKVYKVNTSFDSGLAQKYAVAANPTLLFVKDGKEEGRKVGMLKPSELKDWIEELL